MADDTSTLVRFAEKLQTSEAIVIGAASGMSAAAGFRHYYERDDTFVSQMGNFERKYGFHSSFDGFYHRYPSSAHRWAFIAQMTCTILDAPVGKPYEDLLALLQGKNFHVLTTNQDIQFTHILPESKISAIQGDWRYLQCGHRCHDELFDAVEVAHRLNDAIDENLCVPKEMIPRCPHCGAELEPWVRSYVFLEGKKYREEYAKINAFLQQNKRKKILFLELGVGRMTPMFIQEPFWQMTYALPNAYYITINPKDAIVPDELKRKGMAIHEDIARVLADTRAMTEGMRA